MVCASCESERVSRRLSVVGVKTGGRTSDASPAPMGGGGAAAAEVGAAAAEPATEPPRPARGLRAPFVSLTERAPAGLGFTRPRGASILGPVDLRQLEIFVKVAELGSFSKAADALFLTQPTVSEHIQSLEDELGVRLLDRLGRGAAVTKGGALLQGYAQRLLALSREARQAMESFQGRMSGELLVGASTIPGEYILPALIGRFKEKFPDIAITLLIGGSQAVTEWVAEGRAEVGVVGARSGHRGIEFRELLPDDIVLIVGAAHPWHGRKQVTLEELRAEPLLLRERGSGTRAALEAALTQAGTDIARLPRRRRDGLDPGDQAGGEGRVSACRSCRGGPSRRSAGRAASGASASKDLKITRAFYLATHRERSRSPLAEAFRAFVEAEAV